MYRGRFAPTPSGPLHLGSLIAALASWLDARWHNGQWLVRIEDIDPPREMPGVADQILHALEAFGLHWDEPVLYQSQRHAAYQEAVDHLLRQHKAFFCSLSRKDLSSLPHHPGPPAHPVSTHNAAVRIHAPALPICFSDRFQGHCVCSPEQVDHFVIKRRDGLFAYQLATALDDAFQGITHVVRGADLLDSTARQIHLLNQLQHPIPSYGHIALLTDANGDKLSKSHAARPIDPAHPAPALCTALAFLGIPVEKNWLALPAPRILQQAHQWTTHHWHENQLHYCRTMQIAELPFI